MADDRMKVVCSPDSSETSIVPLLMGMHLGIAMLAAAHENVTDQETLCRVSQSLSEQLFSMSKALIEQTGLERLPWPEIDFPGLRR